LQGNLQIWLRGGRAGASGKPAKASGRCAEASGELAKTSGTRAEASGKRAKAFGKRAWTSGRSAGAPFFCNRTPSRRAPRPVYRATCRGRPAGRP